MSKTSDIICALDHVVDSPSLFRYIFAYSKQSKTGVGEGLGMRLEVVPAEKCSEEYAWLLYGFISPYNFWSVGIQRESGGVPAWVGEGITSGKMGSEHSSISQERWVLGNSNNC